MGSLVASGFMFGVSAVLASTGIDTIGDILLMMLSVCLGVVSFGSFLQDLK